MWDGSRSCGHIQWIRGLGLKGALQRAEGPRWGDDRGKARHGWWVGVEETVSVEGVNFSWIFLKISGRGTHHGRCWGGHDGVGEGCEGVLVGVLVGVLMLMLVLMLVLVELGAQVGWRAQ